MKLLLGESETFNILVVSHINELRFALVHYIVVADVMCFLSGLITNLGYKSFADLILLVGKSVGD